MSRFYIGQKIVCVPIYGVWQRFELENPGWEHPIKDKVYTVRQAYYDKYGEVWAVRLLEILGRPHPILGVECGWEQAEFQPLVDRKTDISIFEKILKGELRPLEDIDVLSVEQ